MKAGIISFTQSGKLLSGRIRDLLESKDCCLDVYVEEACLLGRSRGVEGKTLAEVTADYIKLDAVIFVGACGIAVRAIAPYIRDKKLDPAVIVIDEKGQFVIPILAGHIGGANYLATEIAGLIDGQAVLTTATDVNNKFAVDLFAKQNNLHIWSMKQAKQFSAALLEGRQCGIFFSNHISEITSKLPFETTVVLIPQNIYIGIGCRKGKDKTALKDFVEETLLEQDICKESIAAIASIDIKSEEDCIINLARTLEVPVYFYTSEELAGADSDFTSSDFVTQVTGVDNVCERSAFLASDEGRCLSSKKSKDGMTIAIYEKQINWKGLHKEIAYVSQVYGAC